MVSALRNNFSLVSSLTSNTQTLMRFEKAEKLQVHNQGRRYSCFLYVEKSHDQGDSVYTGSECGMVSVYHLQAKSSHISSVKEEDLSRESVGHVHHNAKVNCLLYSNNRGLSPSNKYGLLFSGGQDRSVKVWDSYGSMLQTLPHTGSVCEIADGHDGTIITICEDGYMRMWSPQRGRSMMLHPFFECTYHVCVLKLRVEGWLAALAVNPTGTWSCYLGENDGSVSIYRKPVRDLNLSHEENGIHQSQLKRHGRWDSVHKLGITKITCLVDHGFVVTISADCSCKILDQFLGHAIYYMENKAKCIFTGISMMNNASDLLLTDELGNVQKFNFAQEKIVDSTVLCKPSRIRKDKILNNHINPMLGQIVQFRGMDIFLTFINPQPKRGLVESNPEPVSVLNKHDVDADGGEIALWTIIDGGSSVSEFKGHEGMIVDLGLYSIPKSKSETKAMSGGKKNAHVLQVSKEESCFFSTSSDYTIRCWDEFDAKESYQFKSKSKADILCLCMLWSMNSLATGHENGMITLWNADAGTFVTAKDLNSSLTSIVEARNSRSHILVGADYSGKIAVWNLTLYHINPIQLPLETKVNSRHNHEDPGILSLAFHEMSNTFFTGGNDTDIVIWRFDSESFITFDSHKEPVCCLKCSENYLLSGDEGGEVFLSSICVVGERGVLNNPLPTLIPLVKFFSFGEELSSRAIISLKEADENRLFVLHSGDGPEGKSILWKVWLHPETDNIVEQSSRVPLDTVKDEENDGSGSKEKGKETQLEFSAENGHEEIKSAEPPVLLSFDDPCEENEQFRIRIDADSSTCISIINTKTILLDEGDVTCADFLLEDDHIRSLYFGNTNGLIVKHDVNLSINIGEV